VGQTKKEEEMSGDRIKTNPKSNIEMQHRAAKRRRGGRQGCSVKKQEKQEKLLDGIQARARTNANKQPRKKVKRSTKRE
jgi:hypothetical protein